MHSKNTSLQNFMTERHREKLSELADIRNKKLNIRKIETNRVEKVINTKPLFIKLSMLTGVIVAVSVVLSLSQYSYLSETKFVYMNCCINGIIFGLTQINLLLVMIREKIKKLDYDELKNFQEKKFKVRNIICFALVEVTSVVGSIIYGKLVMDRDHQLVVYGIFIYFLIVIIINIVLVSLFYSFFLAINQMQLQQLIDKKKFSPDINPLCYNNFIKDLGNRVQKFEQHMKVHFKYNEEGLSPASNKNIKSNDGPHPKSQYQSQFTKKQQQVQLKQETFINPMVFQKNITSVFLNLLYTLTIYCMALYIERIYQDNKTLSHVTVIYASAYLIFQILITKICQRAKIINHSVFANVFLLVSILVIPYKLTFLRTEEDRFRYHLILAKIIYKLVLYFFYPVIVAQLILKIRKSYISTNFKKSAQMQIQQEEVNKANNFNTVKQLLYYQYLDVLLSLIILIMVVIFNNWPEDNFLQEFYKLHKINSYVIAVIADVAIDVALLLILLAIYKNQKFFLTIKSLIEIVNHQTNSMLGVLTMVVELLLPLSIFYIITINFFKI